MLTPQVPGSDRTFLLFRAEPDKTRSGRLTYEAGSFDFPAIQRIQLEFQIQGIQLLQFAGKSLQPLDNLTLVQGRH